MLYIIRFCYEDRRRFKLYAAATLCVALLLRRVYAVAPILFQIF